MRLVLVDATYELFRAYFGAPSRTGRDGREIGAVAGLAASMLALLREQEPLAIAAATDTVIHSFRNELFAGYKSGEGVPEALLLQFPLAEEALEALGMTVWRMREFEADDALASAVEKYGDEAEQVILASPDKDLAQCVSGEQVVMWDRRKGVVLDESGVREKYGVGPESIPDYLALVGDAADGLPGIEAWGAKSTSAVLGTYIHLEEIPEAHGDWSVKVRGAGRLARTLREGRDEADLYKRLATLRRDVPLSQPFGDLVWEGVPQAPWQAFCEDVGLGGLGGRTHRWL